MKNKKVFIVLAAVLSYWSTGASAETRSQDDPETSNDGEARISRDKARASDKSVLPGTFAVINVATPDSPTAKEFSRLHELLDGTSFGKALQDMELRKALMGAPFDESFEKAENKLKKGRALYGELKFTEAVNVLEKAKSLFLEQVPQEKAAKGLVSILSYLILSHNSLGQEDKMLESGKILYHLTDSASPETIPASLWKRIRPKKKRLKRPIKIRSPREAKVYVNFKLLENAAAPFDDKNALWSLHADTGLLHVIVEARGQKKFYTEIQPGRNEVYVAAGMTPLPEDPFLSIRNSVGDWQSKDTPPGNEALLSVAQKAGADRLVLVRKKDNALILQVFEAKKKRLVPLLFDYVPSVAIEHSDKLSLWTAAVAESLAPKPKPKKIDLEKSKRKAAVKVTEKKPLPEKKKPTPVWKRWYFWTALGVVGIVTVVFAVRKDPESQVEIKVQRP